jgi:hypothetical protein
MRRLIESTEGVSMFLRTFLTGLAALALAAPLPLHAAAAPAITPPALDAASDTNTLDAHQLHIDNARVPGAASSRQSVTAWQVVSGTWDGQTLDGLSLVLVKTTTDNAPPATARQVDCYVSHLATPAQRSALINAFLSSQPHLLSPRDAAHMRIEPGVITIEVESGAIILHIGLVA